MLLHSFRSSLLTVFVVVLSSAAAVAQSARQAQPFKAAPAPAIQGFSVVLVVGSTQGTSSSEGVPEAARKALADMTDFLPYKRYQLIDAAWMLCCASFHGGPGITGRMRGPDNREYSYTIDPIEATDSKVSLRFSLREAAAATAPDTRKMSETAKLVYQQQLHEAVRQAADASIEMKRVQQLQDVGLVNPADYEKAKQRLHLAEQRVAELQLAGNGGAARAATRAMIDSTFAITPGETVVIGTSRVAGDQALIALLTAATKRAPSR
jgi:hypothetical protein